MEYWNQIWTWIETVPKWIWFSLVGLSIFSILISVLLTPKIIHQLPEDYFTKPNRSHYRKGWLFVILQNILGWFLILAGILMCFVPGQGLLTILVGVVLINFPGKRKLECSLFQKSSILRKALNWIREKGGKSPFIETV